MGNKKRDRSYLYELGVIHGRFQVLHNDHLRYLIAGKKLCAHLVIGITNPDPSLSRSDETDPHRSLEKENPLTYYERQIMVKECLVEAGLSPDEFTIVPLPINLPELCRYYVPMDAVFFLTIYDDWGRKKLENFKDLGLKTHILWEVPIEEKGISSADIREAMIQGLKWEHLVPKSVMHLLNQWEITKRLRTQESRGVSISTIDKKI